jgi:hypothetical protein
MKQCFTLMFICLDMKIQEFKGSVNLIEVQMNDLQPIFEFVNNLKDLSTSDNVLDFISETIRKTLIKELSEEFNDKLMNYLPREDFNDKISGYSRKQDVTRLTEGVKIIEQRFDFATETISNLEEDLRDIKVDLDSLRKDIGYKTNIDEFKEFKGTVEKYYATKEHIREVNVQIKG